MAKKVPSTKSEIMAAIADAAGISKKQAVAAYDKLLAIAYDGAKGSKGIVLPGLGKLIRSAVRRAWAATLPRASRLRSPPRRLLSSVLLRRLRMPFSAKEP